MNTPADDSDPHSDSASVEIVNPPGIHPFNRGWPTETHLVYPTGGRVALRPQNETITHLVQTAIQNLHISIAFEDAFPDPNLKNKYNKDALYKAAKTLNLDSIVTRIKKDSKYVTVLSGLVCRFHPKPLIYNHPNCLRQTPESQSLAMRSKRSPCYPLPGITD